MVQSVHWRDKYVQILYQRVETRKRDYNGPSGELWNNVDWFSLFDRSVIQLHSLRH